jgi:hypothetical protein
MDFSLWSGTNMRLAKLTNIILSKKTGNVTLDQISARKTATDDENVMSFDWSDADIMFDLNRVIPVTRYAPPTGLGYDSVSRITSYDVSLPFKVKGGKISDITYDKGTKQGTPGYEYYAVTVNRYL